MAEEITSSFGGLAEETARLASIQLASLPEETSSSFTAPSPACYSYRESFMSAAGPERRIRSPPSSQLGQSRSNYSSISTVGASSSYLFDISGSASAGAADFGSPSVHKVISSSLSKQLASVSVSEERGERTTVSTAPSLPCYSYRESIRSVVVVCPEWRIRSSLSSNYSSYSVASSSYQSNISGCSSVSADHCATDLGAAELTKIARRMVSDGYTQRIVRAAAMDSWFSELDVNWVLQVRQRSLKKWEEGDYREEWEYKYKLPDTSASGLQDLAERWIRALTIIIASIKELVEAVNATVAVGRFGEASITAMLVFVEAFVRVSKVENLNTLLQMYICVCDASYDILTKHLISSYAQRIFNEIVSLFGEGKDNLIQDISYKMKDRMRLVDGDDSWAIKILQGRGEVHRNIQLLVDCILSLRKAQASTENSNTRGLQGLIDKTTSDLKVLLWRKSELCADPSLGYLFLLNNSHFVVQMSEPSKPLNLELGLLTPECEKYMDQYLEVSWGHVLSCFTESNYTGPLHRLINTSPLAKFQSAFNKTYQAQRFWKVPDPELRSLLREAITKRVIPGYREYLKEHPEQENHASRGSSSPAVFEQLLGELFEG